ncbi:MAG: hypothetical protein K2P84_14725 [Undibacterium sp.]|nr:hypothetical protein [Undibacterium sp.]
MNKKLKLGFRPTSVRNLTSTELDTVAGGDLTWQAACRTQATDCCPVSAGCQTLAASCPPGCASQAQSCGGGCQTQTPSCICSNNRRCPTNTPDCNLE